MRRFLTVCAVALCFGVQGGSVAAQAPQATPPSGAAATAPAATPPAATAPAATEPLRGDDYDARLRDLEEKVVGLKEKVYKTKSRLVLLREQILHNVIAEAKAVVVHRNEMSGDFTLEQVLYFLDGKKIYFQDNRTGTLDDRREFEIFNGNVLPGNHMVSVELVYRGSGGMFSYVDGYLFKIKSNYTFFATKGRITKVAVVGYEKGDITTDLQDKPYVKYEVQQFQYSKENLARFGAESSTNQESE